ncbi:AMP phosphorylase [Nitrosopumilus sp.]|uniref:AMP phosphorylase n=1 Tax=Nitrosopumilus sp. TaxID=2024843 RepID=UPI00293193B3|nr:AMP phosphorylase [Nitrosopumilus sp.]
MIVVENVIKDNSISKERKMQLKVKILNIDSGGKPVVFLNDKDADELNITASERVIVQAKKKITAIINISQTIEKGFLGATEEIRKLLALKQNSKVSVDIAPFPKSLQFIRNKLSGKKLLYPEIREIVQDLVDGNLSENEISAFVTALHIDKIDLDEATSLSRSMIDTGKTLNINKKIIVDKHSVGGVPGDKTTLLVVPIIASEGFTIPKTSSRAITSVAGTADRAEVLMPVEFTTNKMVQILNKSNGCIVWGGAIELAPADDLFVKAEFSLHIDPLLLPSIMSKKKAGGATHLIVDIPTGRGAKMKTTGEGDLLARDIIELGRRLGIHTHCILTFGEQPIGNSIGPALEAKEALEVLMNQKNVPDLINKACSIAGSMFELLGKKDGFGLAKKILESGKAEQKMRQIIKAQGGDALIKPEDILIGKHLMSVSAKKSGQVLWMENRIIVEIGRAAGAPKDKGAGIVFNKKLGERVEKGELLFTIYAEKSHKLDRVKYILSSRSPIGIGKRSDMLIHKITESPVVDRTFVIDR